MRIPRTGKYETFEVQTLNRHRKFQSYRYEHPQFVKQKNES